MSFRHSRILSCHPTTAQHLTTHPPEQVQKEGVRQGCWFGNTTFFTSTASAAAVSQLSQLLRPHFGTSTVLLLFWPPGWLLPP